MTRIRVLLIVIVVTMSAAAWPKAGAPIPVPKVKITEAIELATSYFLDKETRAIDTKEFKKSEYIITLVQYTKSFGGWAWKIRFVHPVANDHSVEYKVTGGREVIFLGASE